MLLALVLWLIFKTAVLSGAVLGLAAIVFGAGLTCLVSEIELPTRTRVASGILAVAVLLGCNLCLGALARLLLV